MDKTLGSVLQDWFDDNKVRIHKKAVSGVAEPELTSQIQELIKEAIPEQRKFTPEEERLEIELDPDGHQRRQGYNQAIEDITKALRERNLL